MPRFVLWDVDGTLLRAGEIGADVFDRALMRVFGTRAAGRVTMSGKTDPQIVREYLALMEIDDVETHLPAVLEHLEAELGAAADILRRTGRVLPGVAELLGRLAEEDGVHQSLLTGNIAPNAVVKVSAFGLHRWLDLEIGAYGSDDANRLRLVPIALERARRLRGLTFGPGEVWVVGDTGHDLACAESGGARCLLVATGRYRFDELQELGPDAAMADLSDVDAVFRLLTS